MKDRKRLPRIPDLDGLRGLAALAVFFNHFFLYQPVANGSPSVLHLMKRMAEFGPLGVDVFFCLSGFLITSLLLVDRENASYFHNFYWKRSIRILPVYLVHLTATALFFPHAGGYILLSALFMVNFASPLHVNVVGPAWSLSIEEQFYLIWPQVVRRMRLEGIYYVAFGLIVFSTLARVLVPLWHGGIELKYTFYRCDGLALGAVLGCQWFSKDGRTRLIRLCLGVLNSNITLAAVAIAELTLLVRFSDFKLLPQMNLTSANYLMYRLMRLILTDRVRGGKRLSWLGSPVAVYFGSISYALYLYQGFVILAIRNRFGSPSAAHLWPVLLRLCLDLAICVLVCTVSRYAMELPMQRLRRFVLRPSTPAV